MIELHKTLRLGFGTEVADVPRDLFRQRVSEAGRPDYIPINFFLFNRTSAGIDYVVADELVFQALTARHSARFDKLALFAFNFSYAGRWARSRQEQRRPALWAYHYVRDRIEQEFRWDTSQINADDIEAFVTAEPRYKAQGARKLATNLNYLYRVGRIREFATGRVERWWVDALFLALDRLIEDRKLDGAAPADGQLPGILSQSGFGDIAGKRSLEKDLATRHLARLYAECGARERFSEAHVRERTALKVPDLEWYIANDPRPRGAVHPTNPNILKSIPRACAMLATYAGFEVIDPEELETFDAEDFVRRHTQAAIERLRAEHVRPTMSAEELMKMTRDQ
ncbi:MAG TPA: hypothetical protein VHW05_15350 [Phenylobacterium sp.]|nr:hypothetical protein [Phenylobacterium sp.]